MHMHMHIHIHMVTSPWDEYIWLRIHIHMVTYTTALAKQTERTIIHGSWVQLKYSHTLPTVIQL